MKLFSSLVSKLNIPCREAKKRVWMLVHNFCSFGKGSSFQIQISGVSGVVFSVVWFVVFCLVVCFFSQKWTKHNLDIPLNCILCLHSIAGAKWWDFLEVITFKNLIEFISFFDYLQLNKYYEWTSGFQVYQNFWISWIK